MLVKQIALHSSVSLQALIFQVVLVVPITFLHQWGLKVHAHLFKFFSYIVLSSEDSSSPVTQTLTRAQEVSAEILKLPHSKKALIGI